jgi:hypothetical protein
VQQLSTKHQISCRRTCMLDLQTHAYHRQCYAMVELDAN